MRVFLLLTMSLGALSVQADEAPPIRPGLWEFSMVGAANNKQNVCLTPTMVKDIQSPSQRGKEGSDCKISDQSKSGATQKYKITCTKPQKYEAMVTTTITSPDNFSVQRDHSMEQDGHIQKGSLKINYKRLGDC